MRKILFLGDWYINSPANAHQAIKDYPFIFNLEAPITKRGLPTPGKINLRMEQNRIKECFGRNPAAICLANNHIADYGNEAIDDTFAELSAMGILFFGAGSEDDNYNNPAILEVDSHKIALLGYVCPSTHPIFASKLQMGVCPISIERIKRDCKLARELNASRIVVCLHWGVEEVRLPKPQDVALAHHLIDSGVDLIVGHHAHVPQLVEIYRGKTIAYGLGNFMMRDLNVTLYSSDGKPNGRYAKKNTFWNNASLGLVWDVVDDQSTFHGLYFDGQQITNRQFSGIKGAPLNRSIYHFRFQFGIRYQRLRRALGLLAKNPKRLRLRHASTLIKTFLRPET